MLNAPLNQLALQFHQTENYAFLTVDHSTTECELLFEFAALELLIVP